ncbi:MAG: hypothetical protein ACOC5K_03425 [Chloroflexota bacterium]
MQSLSKIFVVGHHSVEVTDVMAAIDYDAEEALQRAIERNPDLIPGDQIDPEAPLRWMVVKRESGVPFEAGGSDRWSVDLVLVDQNAVPTLVECKQSSNPEIRRAVVGQLLEYAANAASNWRAGALREHAEATAEQHGDTLERATIQLVGDAEEEPDVEGFWAKAEENLRRHRLRLVIAADRVPLELQNIMSFLDSETSNMDVLTVEIKLYEGAGQRALVPRLVGRSAQTQVKKSAGSRRPRMTVDAFMAQVDDEAYAHFLHELFGLFDELGLVRFDGSAGFSFKIKAPRQVSVCWAYPPGKRGWGGLYDLSLGYETKYEVREDYPDIDPLALDALYDYSEEISALGGAGIGEGARGAIFSPEQAMHRKEQIFAAVRRLVERVNGSG